MQIFGLSAGKQVGKDTSFRYMKALLAEQGLYATQLSFASVLKDVCCLMFGWDRQRLDNDTAYKEGDALDDGKPDPACSMLGMTRRTVMQRLGTDAMRNGLHQDVWIFCMELALHRGDYNSYDVGIFTDCRFFNELSFVREMGGALVRIDRLHPVEPLSDEDIHASEVEWQAWDDWDAIILNDPTPTPEERSASLARLRRQLSEVVLARFVPSFTHQC